MDKAGQDNRAKQLNPNNPAGGGVGNRPAGYQGQGNTADLKNHGQQMDPNHPKFGKN